MLVQSMDSIRRVTARDLKSGRQFRWVQDVSRAASRFLTRTDPQLIELLKALEIRSLIVVPLRTGRRLLGAVALARTTVDRPYHAADLAVAQVIARKAAVAIDNAELHQRAQDEATRHSSLEDALQRWIRVFDLAGWGAAIVDAAELRIDSVNPAFARIHGYPHPESLIGQLFTTLLLPDQSDEMDRWGELKDRSEAYESVHLRADGTTFPVLTDVTALEMEPGAASYVVTVQDVTELKRAEERLRRAQRMEAVGRLAGGVAHEVNNMMTIILGFGDLLAAADLPADRKREVEEIRKAAIRTARTTQQLLAFSRQQVLQPADLEVNEVVGEMSRHGNGRAGAADTGAAARSPYPLHVCLLSGRGGGSRPHFRRAAIHPETVYRCRAGGRRRPRAGQRRRPWWAGNYMIIFWLDAVLLPPR
jgi:PAS domain S-box-containing protein